jgi:hypothetical protein
MDWRCGSNSRMPDFHEFKSQSCPPTQCYKTVLCLYYLVKKQYVWIEHIKSAYVCLLKYVCEHVCVVMSVLVCMYECVNIYLEKSMPEL